MFSVAVDSNQIDKHAFVEILTDEKGNGCDIDDLNKCLESELPMIDQQEY